MDNHHIIVGDGLTAAEFATSRQYAAGDALTIIGPDVQNIGRGIAYAKAPDDAPWRFAYLLNSPSRSVDPGFAQWMNEHWELLENTMSTRKPDWVSAARPYSSVGDIASLNAPREMYGDFLHAKTIKALEQLSMSGVSVSRVQSRVDKIQPTETALRVVTANGQQFHAQTVDVATGGPENQRIEGDESDRSFPQLFGNEHRIAELLNKGGDIVCIGASAAMLDCLRFCQSIQSESNLQFTAISPKGTLFEPLRPSPNFSPTKFNLTGTFDSAEQFLIAIKTLHEQALDSGDSFYETRVGMRELFAKRSLNEFVPRLSEARKVTRPLFTHFEGGTRDSIDDFHRLMGSGNTRIVAGRVERIENRKKVSSVVFTDAMQQQQSLSASVVVNCAGPGSQNRVDPLTRQMLKEQWISVCEHSGGIIVGENGNTSIRGVRYLGPAVTSIGQNVEHVPLYDASRLRHAVQRFNQLQK